jgi:hypothetical protein
MTTIDFGQLMKDAGEGFQPVPSGPYNAQVVKAEATQTANGKPMIKIQLQIVGGPSDGRKLFDQFVISAGNPNALSYFFEHMAAFGLDRSYFASNPALELVAATMMGRQVMVSVGVKEYKGADRNEVQAYKPIGMGGGGIPAGVPAAAAPSVAPVAPVAPAPVAPAPVAAPVAPVAAPVAPAPVPAPVAPAPVAPVPAAVVPPPAAVAPPAPVAAPVPAAPEVVAAPVPAVEAPVAPVAPAPAAVAPPQYTEEAF